MRCGHGGFLQKDRKVVKNLFMHVIVALMTQPSSMDDRSVHRSLSAK
jgi:hypothetical protein